MKDQLAGQFESVRRELASYLCRLVVRPQVADELVQMTFVRCLEALDHVPRSLDGVRAWLFRVATNLAIDELRRHARWRETMLEDLRVVTEADVSVMGRSIAMVSSPETKAIAREHLTACFACVLRNLPERRAAALLLKEVHGFSLGETADMLEASPTQVKNWLQEARATMTERYAATCALIAKTGVCHQCVELDGFFDAGQGSPLKEDRSLNARIGIAGEFRNQAWGPWHRMVFELIEELA